MRDILWSVISSSCQRSLSQKALQATAGQPSLTRCADSSTRLSADHRLDRPMRSELTRSKSCLATLLVLSALLDALIRNRRSRKESGQVRMLCFLRKSKEQCNSVKPSECLVLCIRSMRSIASTILIDGSVRPSVVDQLSCGARLPI